MWKPTTTTPPPSPMDGRGTENKPEGLHSESLSWLEAPWSTMGWILQLHPLPPWMGEVLKTGKRACTVRAYLGWKHHEAPWSEYYNSTSSPHGWERYLKQARRPAKWELILVGRTMKHHGVNITTPPTTLPPLPAQNASPSQAALPTSMLTF